MDHELDPTVPSLRRPHVRAAAIGVALALGIGGFAVGTAVSSRSTPTVRLTNAAADSATSGTPGTPGAPKGRGQCGRTAGKVTSVNGTSFVLVSPRGTTAVHTDRSTTFSMLATGTVGDAAVGSRVLVHGTPGVTNTIAAQQILVIGPKSSTAPTAPTDPNHPQIPHKGRAFPPGGEVTMGTVASNGNGTLTVTTPSSTTVTVTTDSKTIVVKQVDASLSDMKTDGYAAVKGAPAADGSVTATHVEIVPAALANRAIASLKGLGIGSLGVPGGGFFRSGHTAASATNL